ncbi:hypothetical protein O181_027790 [Austropuccinia psidii MF-1]|uniref:Uncharacterized protein n=1 Tax=Austropuccinia psidii MF-1 TaxID=1389203 RepID=A0A9Q3CS20_9BASI|nr:hypothetical protein [Austropuccinia psidii MF-1]
MRLQHFPPSLPSSLLRLLHPSLIFSLAYNPYATAGPSIYASNTGPTPRLLFTAAYNSYAPAVPPSTPLTPNPLSAAYHPYAQALDT